ncbi:hypothetical protein GAY31_17515, partial [Azospirillum brasilense]|nr:hypothetical protein [Azospirillum brasilense]
MHPCRTLSISLALLSVTTALTAPPAAAEEPAPITVQTGDHADFSRLALVNAQGAPAVDVGSCGGRIAFSQTVPWPLEALNGTYSRRLTGFQTGEEGRRLPGGWPCGAPRAARRGRRGPPLPLGGGGGQHPWRQESRAFDPPQPRRALQQGAVQGLACQLTVKQPHPAVLDQLLQFRHPMQRLEE